MRRLSPLFVAILIGCVDNPTRASSAHELGQSGISVETPSGYELTDSEEDELSFSRRSGSSGARLWESELSLYLFENGAELTPSGPPWEYVREILGGPITVILPPRERSLRGLAMIEFAAVGEATHGGGTLVLHQQVFQFGGSVCTCSLITNPSLYAEERKDLERFCGSIRLPAE